jgi:hypothetical protein
MMIITDLTAHNSRSDRTVLDKTIKEQYSVGLAIPNSHNLHSEKLQKYRLESRAYKNVATQNGQYDVISTIQNGYVSKQVIQKHKTA